MTSALPSALVTFSLPGSDVRLSRLGYGCASLMAHTSRADSVRLLEQAFAAGITHFDVARSYGYGEAESALGDFLQGRREQVTVTTKLGVLPPSRSGGLSLAKSVVRTVAGRSQTLRRIARRGAAAMVKEGRFSPQEARASFETSLRELRVDHVDLLLLHDCGIQDLGPELLELLESWQREGRIGDYGIATKRADALAIARGAPQFAPIVQVPDAVLDPPPAPELGDRLLTHSALGVGYARLLERFGGPQGHAASAETAVDLADPAQLARLMLAAALRRNPNGVVLTSSRDPAHIEANVRLLDDPPSAEQLDAFERVLCGVGTPA